MIIVRIIPWCTLFLAAALLPMNGCDISKRYTGSRAIYTIKKTAAAPVIDGTINDSCWKDLPAIDFVLLKDGGRTKNQTSVRLVYDDKYLYISFECQDTDAASRVKNFDGPVMTDGEFVSLFIDAGNDTTGYFMINVAPTGAVQDAYVLNSGNGESVRTLYGWNCEKLRTSVAVYGDGAEPGNDDRFWTVEMAIPFTEMMTAHHIPPLPGDTWRVNFYRLELSPSRETSAAFPDNSEYYHTPQQFAVILFGE